MNVVLAMFKSDGTRRDFPVKKDRVILGRARGCDLRIPLSSVSRQHCEIKIDGEHLLIRDLGSSNGTFKNHSRVQESALKAGDEVSVGPVIFRVIINGEPAELLENAGPDTATVTDEPVTVIEEAPAAEGAESDQDPLAALAAAADEGPADTLAEPEASPAEQAAEDAPVLLDDADDAPVLPEDSMAAAPSLAGDEGSAVKADADAVTADDAVEVVEEMAEEVDEIEEEEEAAEVPPTPAVTKPAPPAAPKVEAPLALAPDEPPVVQEPAEDDLPVFTDEAEAASPTVDMDDPIAALEAMAASEAVDSGEIPMLSDEEEKPVKPTPKPQPKPAPKPAPKKK